VVLPVGITAKSTPQEKERIYAAASGLVDTLKAAGVKATADLRDNVTPGWKFNHWELKGVPVRFEVGPKDLAANEVRAGVRHSGEKFQLSLEDIAASTKALLDRIHGEMLAKAQAGREAGVKPCAAWEDLMAALDARCSALMPWCEEVACEEAIKERSTRKDAELDQRALSMGAKSLCIPFEQPEACTGKPCLGCGKPAKRFALFGRSY
jgi:prolyl-tRNA synthetase